MAQLDSTAPLEADATAVVYPWGRFCAKLIDVYIFGMIVTYLYQMIFGPVSQVWQVVLRAVLFPLVESVLLTLWGTTPGKVAFHISILRPNGEKLRLPVALKRSYASWIRGAFAGIPPIFLIAMIIAYNNYTKHKATS